MSREVAEGEDGEKTGFTTGTVANDDELPMDAVWLICVLYDNEVSDVQPQGRGRDQGGDWYRGTHTFALHSEPGFVT